MANFSALYSGPCDLFYTDPTSGTTYGIQSEAENGTCNIEFAEKTAEIGAAQWGKIGEQIVAQEGMITTKPFDNWGSLAAFFPPFLGATVGAAPAALKIGTRPHNPLAAGIPASDAATKVWTPDGRLYTGTRAAIIGVPSLHLGVGKALYDSVKIACLPPSPGAVALLSPTGTVFTMSESGNADPAVSTFTMSDFIREAWTGVWGVVAGFGGAAGSLQGSTPVPVQADDEWKITAGVKYSAITIQGGTVAYKLDSVAYMASCKPYGPSHTDILAAIQSVQHGQGKRLGRATLTLTSSSGKTIKLQNSEIKGAGFSFGGTGIGTGEIGFVTQMGFNTDTVPSGSAGQPDALIIFIA